MSQSDHRLDIKMVALLNWKYNFFLSA